MPRAHALSPIYFSIRVDPSIGVSRYPCKRNRRTRRCLDGDADPKVEEEKKEELSVITEICPSPSFHPSKR